MDYKTLEETVLLFWDTEENYSKEITQQKLIPEVFQKAVLIDSLEKLKETLNSYSEDQKFLFLIHINHAKENLGLSKFKASKILASYPNLKFYHVSSTSKKQIYENGDNNGINVFSYDNIHDVIGSFVRQTKDEMLNSEIKYSRAMSSKKSTQRHFDYAILTALYDDEFEALEEIFDFPKEEFIAYKTKKFRVGYLKTNKNIQVIATFLNETGPVEAGIVATIMLELFTPKYLLMSGVCGGADQYKFGDIIIAKKIFAFQKGKISDHSSLLDLLDENSDEPYMLYDIEGNAVDPKKLFDSKQNHIPIKLEKFELEHDAMISLDTIIEDDLNSNLKAIKAKINTDIKNKFSFSNIPPEINIVIEPMASGTMVINKKGYFEEVIKAIHRKVAAVEMESYGLARACQFGNQGTTIPIVFKSVMDHTFKKEDAPGGIKVKKFAAFTSAMFMKYLFEDNVI